MKICHLTSVHPRYDVRIFHKECKTLQKHGYNVTLIVADSYGNEKKADINIIDVGKIQGRIKRILKTTKKVYKKALQVDADIYHFHDPELIPWGLKLTKKGKKVIYDVHEDLPRQLLSKPYLNKFLKNILSKITEKYENFAAKKMSGIITATDFIKQRFEKFNPNTVAVKNYPLTDVIPQKNTLQKTKKVIYIGLLSRIRGIKELVQASALVDAEFVIAGKFSDKAFEDEIKSMPEWKNINFLGFLDRDKIIELLEQATVGIVTLYPTINYKDALPVKMFEYMLAGLPVIASDIKLWKEIITENNCGFVVNPHNPEEIAEKINIILSDNELANKLGENGKNAILKKYNWQIESKHLIKFYTKLS